MVEKSKELSTLKKPTIPYVTHTDDDLALRLVRAMNDLDLEALVTLMPWGMKRREQARTLLRPVFAAAREQRLSLLHPPEQFHAWILDAVNVNIRGGTATQTTANTRLSYLNVIYTQLMDLGLLVVNPLRGLKRYEHTRQDDPALPGMQDIQRLLFHAAADPHLNAALLLIYHHAFFGSELRELTWGHYLPQEGKLIRRFNVTPLSQEAAYALERLRVVAGGVFADPSERIFPYHDDEAHLRQVLLALCQQANLPYPGLRELRRSSLRDFVHGVDTAGFATRQQLDRAIKLAQKNVSSSSSSTRPSSSPASSVPDVLSPPPAASGR